VKYNHTNGEVSTRLIVALAIVGVIAIAAVPLGFYIVPAIKSMFEKEKRELLFEETFEELKAGEIPDGWERSYDWRSQRSENIGTTHETGCGSDSCLSIKCRPSPYPNMFTVSGGIMRKFSFENPVEIEFDFRISKGGYIHPGLRPQWHIGFFEDQDKICIANGRYVKYPLDDKWYRARIRYDLVGKEIRITLNMRGRKSTESMKCYEEPLRSDRSGYISFDASKQTCFYDNIRIWRIVKNE
jgi:hypothetical protein